MGFAKKRPTTGTNDVDTPSSTEEMTPELRIAYIDRSSLMRDCIVLWLKAGFPKFAIDSFESALDAANAGKSGVTYTLYLYHIEDNPIRSSEVIDNLRKLCDISNNAPLAVLADEAHPVAIAETLGVGARGYVPTSLRAGIAIEALRLVCAGGVYAPAAASHLSSQQASNTTLNPRETYRFTARETQILRCLRKGMANKLIAYELGMSEATVKVHVRNIMKKLRATNRTQVVLRTWDYLEPQPLRSKGLSICDSMA